MPSFHITGPLDGDYFGIEIEADFERELSAIECASVFQLVMNRLADARFNKLLTGLKDFEIRPSSKSLFVRFNYHKWRVDHLKDIFPEDLQEHLDMRRINLIYYIYAVVDQQFSIVDALFLSDFRYWIDLPEIMVRDHAT